MKDESEYKSGDYKEALRKSFLHIDDKLVNGGGLAEVAQLRKDKPPNKSQMMKMM